MTFERPWLLLALVVVGLAAVLYVAMQRRRARYAVDFTNLAVLREVAGRRRAWRRYVPPVLVLLALAALIVGVARPHVQGLVPQDRATVVLVLDVSRSMEAKDVKPNRIGAAKEAIRLFLRESPEKLVVKMWLYPYLTWATAALIVFVLGYMLTDTEHDGRETVLLSLLVAAVVLVIAVVKERIRGDRPAGVKALD